MTKVISIIMAAVAALGLYPKTGFIVETDRDENRIVIEDASHNLWVLNQEVEDWCVGDGVSMIMYNNRTGIIYDDVIISARYNGYWR